MNGLLLDRKTGVIGTLLSEYLYTNNKKKIMDNFDLKKFLKESKAIENLNPTIKALNEGEAAYEYEEGKRSWKKLKRKK
jgi:hypothetical protein